MNCTAIGPRGPSGRCASKKRTWMYLWKATKVLQGWACDYRDGLWHVFRIGPSLICCHKTLQALTGACVQRRMTCTHKSEVGQHAQTGTWTGISTYMLTNQPRRCLPTTKDPVLCSDEEMTFIIHLCTPLPLYAASNNNKHFSVSFCQYLYPIAQAALLYTSFAMICALTKSRIGALQSPVVAQSVSGKSGGALSLSCRHAGGGPGCGCQASGCHP